MTQSVIVAVPVEKGVIKCILELVRLRAGGRGKNSVAQIARNLYKHGRETT